MSFSKAKIKRFNDIKAPLAVPFSISKNNIKEELKPKSRTPANSDYSSETSSIKTTPCFRPPTTIAKKKTTVLPVKTKPSNVPQDLLELEALKEKIVECENKDACINDLREQLEEFKEKVNLLENHKLQLISEKGNYEEALFLQNLEHSKHLQRVMEEFEEIIIACKSKEKQLKDNISLLKKDIEALKKEHDHNVIKLKDNCDKIQETSNKLIEEQRKVMELKTAELIMKEKELKIFEEECTSLQREHAMEVEKMRKAHQLEIQDIELGFLKTITELQTEKDVVLGKIVEIEEKAKRDIEQMNQFFQNKNLMVLNECDKKIKEVQETSKHTFETELNMKITELENVFENKLKTQQKESDAILKECQTISEYNIIQSEIEKNKIQTELEEKNKELNSLQEEYEKLLDKYDTAVVSLKNMENNLNQFVVDLEENRRTLEEELRRKAKIIDTISKEKTSYEISFKTYQKTIDVLKNRLINSDRDVEQLKEELSKCEEKILEYEMKCLQLGSDLKQAQSSNEELEMQFESSIKLNRIEIENLREDLCQKVQSFKEQAEQYSRQKQDGENSKEELIKLKNELSRLQDMNAQYEFEIRRGQNELDGYHLREMDWGIRTENFEDTVKHMEYELKLKQDQLKKLKREIAELRHANGLNNPIDNTNQPSEEEKTIFAKYIQISGRYDEILQKYEDLQNENSEKDRIINNLSEDLKEYSNLREKYIEQVGRVNELLEKLERKEKTDQDLSLKSKLTNMEEERDTLLNKVQHLEGELKEVTTKYVDLAGHQNNKQRIKHLSDLKQKNEDISQQNLDLSQKLQSQKKELDRLKKENSDLKRCLKKQKYRSEDKENVGSPRSLNSSRVESPFRERN